MSWVSPDDPELSLMIAESYDYIERDDVSYNLQWINEWDHLALSNGNIAVFWAKSVGGWPEGIQNIYANIFDPSSLRSLSAIKIRPSFWDGKFYPRQNLKIRYSFVTAK